VGCPLRLTQEELPCATPLDQLQLEQRRGTLLRQAYGVGRMLQGRSAAVHHPAVASCCWEHAEEEEEPNHL
jgi:hypothetical protein